MYIEKNILYIKIYIYIANIKIYLYIKKRYI